MMRFFEVTVLAVWVRLWASASAAPPPAVSMTNLNPNDTLSQELNLTTPSNVTLQNVSR